MAFEIGDEVVPSPEFDWKEYRDTWLHGCGIGVGIVVAPHDGPSDEYVWVRWPNAGCDYCHEVAEVSPLVRQCGDCRFWNSPNGGMGECRRNPPVPLQTCDEFIGVFPVMPWDYWCGEFALKQEVAR